MGNMNVNGNFTMSNAGVNLDVGYKEPKQKILPNAELVEEMFARARLWKENTPIEKHPLHFEIINDEIVFPNMLKNPPYPVFFMFGKNKLLCGEWLTTVFGYDPYIHGKAVGNQLAKFLGVSNKHVKQANNNAKSVFWARVVCPLKSVLPLVRSGAKRVNKNVLTTIKKSGFIENILPQMEKDGLHDLVPICCAANASPQEIKATLGKGLWKRVVHAPKTKKVLIARLLIRNGGNSNFSGITFKSKVELLINIPYTVLNCPSIPEIGVDPNILNILNHKWKEICKYNRYNNMTTGFNRKSSTLWKGFYHDIRDSINVVNGIYTREQVLNRFKNSPVSQWHILHTDYIAEASRRRDEIRRKRMEEDEALYKCSFPFVGKIPSIIKYKGFTATLLKNATELESEGTHMHHCVSGYWRRCHGNESIIYKVEGPTKEDRSTVELRDYMLVQNKHYSNHRVSVDNQSFVDIIPIVLKQFESIGEENVLNFVLPANDRVGPSIVGDGTDKYVPTVYGTAHRF